MNDPLAQTPVPPYYAVIFSSVRAVADDEYEETAAEMLRLAREVDGFLGFESARGSMGISVSYWRDEASIAHWQRNVRHRLAQERGKITWYARYQVRVAKVERTYGWRA